MIMEKDLLREDISSKVVGFFKGLMGSSSVSTPTIDLEVETGEYVGISSTKASL